MGFTIGGGITIGSGIAFVTPTVNTPMTGYIEQLRIATGVARYSANFTPPDTLMPTS